MGTDGAGVMKRRLQKSMTEEPEQGSFVLHGVQIHLQKDY